MALQAVMAAQLDGDTIHHSCGILVYGSRNDSDAQTQRQIDVAKRVLQWKWIIIDEISMVSARLLAEIDVKLRNVVRRVGIGKADETGADRPFAGLNVLVVGDMWQLDPPDGGFLGAIPTDFIKRARINVPGPTVAHGQRLLWGP